MLTIRQKQVAVFHAPAIKAFEDRVMEHLNKCFPKQCKAMDEAELRETIQSGIECAAKYGIVAERDVCKYIDFMMVLGRDFDRDPKLPWASSILNDQALNDPATKIKRLYEGSKKDVQGGGVEHVGR